MPFLAFGVFTVHGAGGGSDFIQSHSTEFTYYSYAPIICILAFLSCLFAIRFHKKLDPTYSVAKVWCLVTAYVGIVLIYLIPSDQAVYFAFPLLSTTLILLIWRWSKAIQILPTFLYAMGTVFVLNFSLMLIVNEETGQLVIFLILSLIISAILVIPLCVIRSLVRTGVTWKRLLTGWFLGGGIPFVPLIYFFTSRNITFTAFLYGLGLLSLTTLPFIILVKWNRWARDVVTGTLFQKTSSSE